MTKPHHSAITCLALSGLAALAAAGQEPQGDLFSSKAAALSFTVPAGSQVYEREISIDRTAEVPGSMVMIRIVPRGMTEEGSLLGAQAVIEVSRLAPATSLKEWVSGGCVPSVGPKTWQESRVAVGGQPAVRRDRRDSDGTSLTQVLVIEAERGYRLSARGPENEAVLRAILDTVQFGARGDSRGVTPAAAPLPAPAAPEVRMLYLLPSDRVLNDSYRLGMDRAIRQLQVFYRTQIANGKAFTLHNPVVEVISTTHPVAWYTTNAPASSPEGRFWESVLADAFALTGGGFNDPSNRWVIYIDADPLCNQYVGGTQGLALLPANDLRGLTCGVNQPPCGGPGDSGGLCRWVGGLGHELGHAFNLPHPTACPSPDPLCNKALMWYGYTTYPDAYLLPSDVSSLLTSASTAQFFTMLDPGPLSFTCSDGCSTTCSSFSISPASANPTYLAGSQLVTITGVPAGCQAGSWTASGNGSWITVLPASGSGQGAVTVSWSSNPSASPRSSGATIAGNSFSVSQGGVTPASDYYTVAPCRVVDTRQSALGPLSAGSARRFTLAGTCGLPPNARGVTINVTVTQPTAPGNLRLFPAGLPIPTASTLNYSAAQTRANNATLALGSAGAVDALCSQASGSAHIIIDVTGYFE